MAAATRQSAALNKTINRQFTRQAILRLPGTGPALRAPALPFPAIPAWDAAWPLLIRPTKKPPLLAACESVKAD
jgi:hypothetical protein